jgi:putative tryptophan/tyrosine transport system substrate-binding protein
MKHRSIGLPLIFALGLLVAPLCAQAQPLGKPIPRIGELDVTSRAVNAHRREALLQGLRDRGWVEGQTFAIEYRSTEGDDALLPSLAAELVRLQVDLIVARNAPATQAAMQATRTIPIVMATGGHDPVEAGFVASLARPGGNVTGVSGGIGHQVSGKWVQLLTEVVPQASRVTALWDPTRPATGAMLREVERTTRSLGLQLHLLEARDSHELDRELAAMVREGADMVIVLPSTLAHLARRQLVEFMAERRLPAIYFDRAFAEAGGLMSYGPNWLALFHRVAAYVDRILKGTKPADLPVEEPTSFELVINLKTAQALGLTIPPTLLFQADEVIR